jgi:hypothetical protein
VEGFTCFSTDSADAADTTRAFSGTTKKLSRRSAVIREIRGRLYLLFHGFRGCSGYDKSLLGNNKKTLA